MDALHQDIRHAVRRLAHSPGLHDRRPADAGAGDWRQHRHLHRRQRGPAPAVAVRSPCAARRDFSPHEERHGAVDDVAAEFPGRPRANHTMADVAALNTNSYTLTGAGAPVRLDGAEVSASFFNVLRVRPILGRHFRPEENEPGRNHVVVLAHQRLGPALRRRQRRGRANDHDRRETVHGGRRDAGRLLVSR